MRLFFILWVMFPFFLATVPLVQGQGTILPCTCDMGPDNGQQFLENANNQCLDSNGDICRAADQPQIQQQPVQQQPVQQQPVQQQTTTVRRVVADVLLLMDVSGSMEALVVGQKINKLKAAKTALINVVEKMVDNARFQLWTFSAKVTQHPVSMGKGVPKKRGKFVPIGSQGSQTRQELSDLINAIEIPKDATVTNLYAAILMAMQYYYSAGYNAPKSGQPPTKVIVVLSDGQDDQLSPIKIGKVLMAKGAFPDIQIKTIGFGIKPQNIFHKELCYLATQQQCALAQNSVQLEKVLKSFTR